jgi:hypothetical protein
VHDPYAEHAHRCPRCGAVQRGEAHRRWWIMGQQLWLAERAVHAAALHALRGVPAYAAFAARVLDESADAYLALPNRDNVLARRGRSSARTWSRSGCCTCASRSTCSRRATRRARARSAPACAIASSHRAPR